MRRYIVGHYWYSDGTHGVAAATWEGRDSLPPTMMVCMSYHTAATKREAIATWRKQATCGHRWHNGRLLAGYNNGRSDRPANSKKGE